jgi:hypothetical protein
LKNYYDFKQQCKEISKLCPTKFAFSLIEISIVILVIGISKGSRMVTESKIKSAQSLTIGSSVVLTKGLSLWLETTMDASFEEDEAIDTALGDVGTIETWNDINPLASTPKKATQTTAVNKPRYIKKGINGLPVLNFDGVGSSNSDNMDLPTSDALGIVNSNYEIFIVYQQRTAGTDFLISGGSNAYEIHLGAASPNLRFISSENVSGDFADMDVIANITAPHIISARVNGDVATIRLDGNDSSNTTSLGAKSSDAGALMIGRRLGGGGLPYDGDIGEIIIFNKELKNSERTAIENYLRKKWGIK